MAGALSCAKVAVVGAGLAGAACASVLGSKGLNVTLFDMGKQHPGGRASTRHGYVEPRLTFDHGAQFFKPSRAELQAATKTWLQQGILEEWRGRIGVLDASTGRFTSRDQLSAHRDDQQGFFNVLSPEPLYVGVPSMDALARHLALPPGIKLHLSTKVDRATLGSDGRWLLHGLPLAQPNATAGLATDLGQYDALVFADMLCGKKGSPGYVTVEGAPKLDTFRSQLGQLNRVPLFVLMAAFKSTTPAMLPFDAATITGSQALAWACNNTSKPGRQHPDGFEAWVFVMTPEFSRQLLEPASTGPLLAQTPEYLEQKTAAMWQAIQKDLAPLLGGKPLPQPVSLRAHRWGSAYSSPSLGTPCYVDSSIRFAACGDFCMGPGVDSALSSGMAAAEAVVGLLGR